MAHFHPPQKISSTPGGREEGRQIVTTPVIHALEIGLQPFSGEKGKGKKMDHYTGIKNM